MVSIRWNLDAFIRNMCSIIIVVFVSCFISIIAQFMVMNSNFLLLRSKLLQFEHP